MLDLSNLPSGNGATDVQIFYGNSPIAGQQWQTWAKPRGKTMLDILLIGKGGNGGTGVVGANSTAAGGGGGGTGSQTRLLIPLYLIPDILYLSLAGISATTTLASYITIQPSLAAAGGVPVANNILAFAGGGANGGNAAGATAGSAGAAGGIATAATMPLGWAYATALAGYAGVIGGTTGVAPTWTQSATAVTGLLVTPGTGGGGLPAAAAAGTLGGPFLTNGLFPLRTAAPAAGANTFYNGENGYQPIPKLLYLYGGIGSGSTHGSAGTIFANVTGNSGSFYLAVSSTAGLLVGMGVTGTNIGASAVILNIDTNTLIITLSVANTGAVSVSATFSGGLTQSIGGNGAYGCGGGGNGGALTGSVVAPTTGRGGPALAIFTCW
jgi:hypothetical protein